MRDSVLTPPAPDDPPVPAPGIGVGVTRPSIPSTRTSGLSRCRVRADRAGLDLHAGEIVLCAPYEPLKLGMVVVLRCEADGYSPGALIPAADVEHLEAVHQPLGACTWSTPGVRPRAGGAVPRTPARG